MESSADQIPSELHDAAERLGALVETEVRRILDLAEKDANDVRRRAEETARRTEGDAQRRAEEIFKAALERASTVLDSIDAIEHGLTGMATGLRAESSTLTAKLTAETTGKLPELPPGEQPEGGDADALVTDAATEVEQLPLPVLIQATLYKMRHEGRSRADAEHVLSRFQIDDLYADILDRVYGPAEPKAAAPPPPPAPRPLPPALSAQPGLTTGGPGAGGGSPGGAGGTKPAWRGHRCRPGR